MTDGNEEIVESYKVWWEKVINELGFFTSNIVVPLCLEGDPMPTVGDT